jgi:RHS repeat-associated protein
LSPSSPSGAIRSGFDSNTYGPNDDGTYPCVGPDDGIPSGCTPSSVSIPFSIDFFGLTYGSLFLNNNGNLTFGGALGTYTPYPLSNQGPPMIAPFFADIDTRTGATATFGTGTVDGHSAWGVTWPDVGCYREITSVLNSLQVILISRSDIGQGDFDIEFNYGNVQWEAGQASGGDANCLGGTAARAGYASGSGATGSYFEIPGSGTNGALLDSNPATGLINNSHDSTQLGRYIYRFRNGLPLTTTGAPKATTGQGNGHTSIRHNPTCSHGQPVNCASGEFWHSFTDVSIPGRGPALNLTRTYNSMSAASKGIFGFGWASTYDAHLQTNPEGTVTITAEDGSQGTAAPSGGSSYSFPSWVDSNLTHNGDGTWTFVRHQTQTLVFSATGRLTSVSDPNGHETTLAYNGSGQLTSVTDEGGRSLDVAYGANGLVSSVTDPGDRVTRYAYDGASNLTSVTDAADGVTRFTYDGNHQLLTMTDPRGGVVTNVYDGNGRVTSQADPMNRATTYAYTGVNYSATGGSTTITDPKGNVEVQQYVSGELVSLTRGKGTSAEATWTYAYDQDTLGRRSSTDPNGHTTTAVYDSAGNMTSFTDALGRTTTTTFTNLNEPLTVTDPSGVTTTLTYDSSGNLTTVSRPIGGSTQTVTFAHADGSHPGDITSTTSARGKVSQFTYDGHGDLATAITAAGDKTSNTYNLLGQLMATVSPRGNAQGADPAQFRTTYVYDALGRLTRTTDPLGHTTLRAYDEDGNLTSHTDSDGNVATYTYDPDNELTKITRADGTTVQYGYDANGNQTSQSDGAGHITGYAYDPLDRIASGTDPLDRTTRFTYDGAGNRTTLVDPAGQTTTYGYDDASQLTSIGYSDGATPNVSFTYTANGLRKTMADGTGTTTYSYDSLNRLTSQTNGAGQMISYGYDLDNNLTSLTYPNGKTVGRAYDDANRLESVTDWLSHTTTLTADPNSNVTGVAYPNGITATSAFNRADQITSVTDKNAGGTTLASFTYTRDPNGQLTSTTPTGTGQGSNETYTYSKLNQLNALNGSPYTYDAADNLTKLSNGATLAYDAANEATSYTPQSGSATTLTYDQRGNRLNDVNGHDYTYDQANRLVTAPGGGGGSAAELLAGGQYHSLAVASDGSVWAWGYNADGELGDGTTASRLTPVQVNGLSDATAVAAGDLHSLALTGGGSVRSWGANAFGQLGDGTTANRTSPVQVSGLSGVTAIAAGNYHSLALKSDGSVLAWGLNNAGQLGDGTTTNRTSPVTVQGLSGVVAVAAGGLPGYAGHSVALKADGTVWAWGYGKNGQLGLGSTSSVLNPQQVPGLAAVVAIAASGDNTYALEADGTVWAWGDDHYGQLGNTSVHGAKSSSPVRANITGVTAIAAGGTHVLALKDDGIVWGWGNNNTGQLGDNGACGKTCDTPVQITNLIGTTALAGGYVHSLAARQDGTVEAWGNNSTGQLGDGTTTVRLTPVQTSRLNDITPSSGATYTYDGDGLRASSGSLEFAWGVASGVPLLLTDGSTSFIYDDQGLPVEQIDSTGTPLYYQHDQLGSTRLLTNGSGAVAGTFRYDPYGNLADHTGPSYTPLRWAGQYQDANGLYYLRARYYDPMTAQFLTRDPLAPVTQQPYGYVSGNPLNLTDVLGLCSKWNPICWGDIVYHGAADAWHAVADPVVDVTSTVYDWAKTHPELVGGAIAITVCGVATLGACEVVGFVVFSGTIALDTYRFETGEISGDTFAVHVMTDILLYGTFRALPELVAAAGRPDLGAYVQIGREFNGEYRALLEANELGLAALARMAATAC